MGCQKIVLIQRTEFATDITDTSGVRSSELFSGISRWAACCIVSRFAIKYQTVEKAFISPRVLPAM